MLFIKRFQDFDKVSVDKLAFAMYCLQLAHGLQLNKMSTGSGAYTTAEGVIQCLLFNCPNAWSTKISLQNKVILLLLNMYQTQCWT